MAQQLQRYWLIFLYFYKVNLSLLLFLQIECSENGQICTFLYSPAFVFQDFALCLSLNLQREHSSGLKCLLGVDFNNILWAALPHSDPKSTKRHWWLECLFALLGSVRVKAAPKHVSNFHNFLRQQTLLTRLSNSIHKCHGSAFFLRVNSKKQVIFDFYQYSPKCFWVEQENLVSPKSEFLREV